MIRRSAYHPTPAGYVFEVQCDYCNGRGGEVFFSPTISPEDGERWPALNASRWKHGRCWRHLERRRKARRKQAKQVQQ